MSELDDKWFQIIVNKTQEIKLLIDEIFIQDIANEGMEDDKKKLTTKNKNLSKENANLTHELRELTNKKDRLAQRCVNAEELIRELHPKLDRCDIHESWDENCAMCHAMNASDKEKSDG